MLTHSLFLQRDVTETRMARACRPPRQPLQTHPSGSLEGGLQGSLEGGLQGSLEGGRGGGQHSKYWMDDTKERTSLPMLEVLTKPPAETTDVNGPS